MTTPLPIDNQPRFASRQFRDYVARRQRYVLRMTASMLVIYFGFILAIAFFPETLARPLGPGGVLTIGIPVGMGVIVFAFCLCAAYVRRANREFDPALSRVLGEEEG